MRQQRCSSLNCFLQIKSFILFQFCWCHNGYLAEVTTKAEEDKIYEWLNKDNIYWIGLTERTEEGIYINIGTVS